MSQPQGESTQALLAALTSQLQSMTVQPNISAVSLKLPEFWTTSPEVWFARVEAQFGTKNISTDQTKYDYVVSALDVKTAEEVQDVLVNPPDANKYSVLKRALLKAFGKSQAQRDNELLNLNGLGGRKPTAVLRKINALKLSPGLDFSLSVALDPKPHQHNLCAIITSNLANKLVAPILGRSYLVDTGAEVSVYPASVQERKSQPPSSTLTAANGTSIHTWGKRKVFLAIGQKGQYQHEFYLADVTRPILGADFFIKHGLAIDLRGKRLLSIDNMSILLRETKSPLTLSGLGFPLKHEYDSLLQQFPELLTPHFHQCNNKHGMEDHIITQGPPTHSRARRLDQAKLSAAKAEFLQMEDMGIIRRSKSAWSSPLHMVPKADGNWRPCGDYRRLNASTDDDRYPLPHIQDFNNHLAGCKVFSKIDLIRGYLQIPMAPSSIPKTAVVTPFGLWEFLRMPFGLKNAAQSFQRLMDGILRDIPFAFVYLDDILVASRSSQEHAQHLEQLFKLLSANGLVINKAKCIFGAEELDFLGHHVSAIGIAPLPDQVAALHDSKPPQNRTARSVLSHHPLPDAPTSLTVDASSTAVGAQLEQRQGQSWVPLAFFSRKLSDAEKKYSAFDRELLASYSAVKHFRHFLEGRPFTLYTDHKPLTFALSSETDRSPRQTRHLAFIAEFTTDIRHIKGKFNVVADALSRITTTSNAADTINLCPVSISHPVEVNWTDFAQLAKDQIQSGEMASYRTATTGLILKDIDIGPSTLFCDTSLGVTRPVLPVSWTRPVFNKIHDLPFLRHLQQTMRSVQPPTPQFHGQPSVYVPANLAPAKFVYVRKDSHKHPLQRPYDGPYLVLNKSDKFFTVAIKGRPETISIDRLKAAFVTQLTTAGDTDRPPEPPSAEPQANSPPQPFLPTSSPSMDNLVTKTRSGRSILSLQGLGRIILFLISSLIQLQVFDFETASRWKGGYVGIIIHCL
ncbi:Pol polyprotein [Plakobranchus ocellatus]|uniref:RNA-directed DNA polymerase n=1 Tax=Plakobranchus ocellatus TaxID=259542 RepID=A0AAV3ZQN6_9GAST|nr:Pol polyprotein [Plakobranchus ocellatus]